MVVYFRASLFMCLCHKDHNSKKSKHVLLENWKRSLVVSMLSSLVTEKFCPNQQGKHVPKTNKSVQEGIYLFIYFFQVSIIC